MKTRLLLHAIFTAVVFQSCKGFPGERFILGTAGTMKLIYLTEL